MSVLLRLAAVSAAVTLLAACGGSQLRPVPVVLLADSTARQVPGGETLVVTWPPVPARWTLPDGTRRTAAIEVKHEARAGQTVRVWMDRTWMPQRPPRGLADLRRDAVDLALLVVVGGGALLHLLYAGIRRRLDDRRLASWEREWTLVEPRWRNRRRAR
ncbi:hypothetical protein [Cryptosporangium sp. NPDC051539]|uniref:hypothetical protein n=1 Tax=Cryptosporangium sp. NPDC051539 TaxID=3363962 RepID=UPI0037AD3EB8